MTQDEFEYDVALSFAGEDRATAEEFAKLLKAKDIRVFYDEFEAAELWGKDLVDHLVNIYSRKARYCVMFISQYYPLKKWTRVERTAAQERAFRDANEYILPLRLDDTQVPGVTETTGYRDLRQHSMESIVDLLDQKLARSKGQRSPAPQSHDLRSGHVAHADTQFGPIPISKGKPVFTQLEKDRFAKEAFTYIKQYFQHALRELESHDRNLQTDFTEISTYEFTCKIYVQGNTARQCHIWLGVTGLMPNTIYYNEGMSGSGEKNSYNDYVSVEDNGEELRLRIGQMGIGVIQVSNPLATKEQAAEYLWKRMTSNLESR